MGLNNFGINQSGMGEGRCVGGGGGAGGRLWGAHLWALKNNTLCGMKFIITKTISTLPKCPKNVGIGFSIERLHHCNAMHWHSVKVGSFGIFSISVPGSCHWFLIVPKLLKYALSLLSISNSKQLSANFLTSLSD